VNGDDGRGSGGASVGDGDRGQHSIDRHLFAGLVRTIDWVDNSLQNILAFRGFEPVHRTQSLILVHIVNGVENPAEIAREMGSTR
jgi:hypothetical protein